MNPLVNLTHLVLQAIESFEAFVANMDRLHDLNEEIFQILDTMPFDDPLRSYFISRMDQITAALKEICHE